MEIPIGIMAGTGAGTGRTTFSKISRAHSVASTPVLSLLGWPGSIVILVIYQLCIILRLPLMVPIGPYWLWLCSHGCLHCSVHSIEVADITSSPVVANVVPICDPSCVICGYTKITGAYPSVSPYAPAQTTARMEPRPRQPP